MKKTIMFFSAIIISAFILFGFQNSDLINTLDNEVITIENQEISNSSSIYHITPNDLLNGERKCGEGKCGEGKCGKDKAKAEKKVTKEVEEVIEKNVEKENVEEIRKKLAVIQPKLRKLVVVDQKMKTMVS